MTIDDAKDACRNSESEFTCAVLCSGGCVCTLASIRAGFKMIWGTEICPEHQSTCSRQQEDLICSCNGNTQQRMWEDLTGAPCLGNTFTSTEGYNAVDDPDYLTDFWPTLPKLFSFGDPQRRGRRDRLDVCATNKDHNQKATKKIQAGNIGLCNRSERWK